jgi:hypothetical protein
MPVEAIRQGRRSAGPFATGALSYDGNGAGGAIQFARMANHAALAAGDFVVI